MSRGDIEQQGRNAFLAARRRHECPYHYGKKKKWWLRGYDLQQLSSVA